MLCQREDDKEFIVADFLTTKSRSRPRFGSTVVLEMCMLYKREDDNELEISNDKISFIIVVYFIKILSGSRNINKLTNKHLNM